MSVPKVIKFAGESPRPLVRETPQGDKYPVEALGPLQAVVKAVADITQAPLAIAAQSALSVISLVVQGFADVEILGGGEAPCSLFCLTIAESGERKSSCDRFFMTAVKNYEREQMEIYRKALAQHEKDFALWNEKNKRITKAAGGPPGEKTNKALKELDALPPCPVQPTLPVLTAMDPTFEGLLKLYRTARPALGLFSDEGGSFIGGYAMNGENRLKTMAGLSNLWNGEAINRIREGDGATTYHGRRLAAHLMVQPVVAYSLLSDPQTSEQGFLPRFLITRPPSKIGERLFREPFSSSYEEVERFTDELDEMLRQDLPTTADGKELVPSRLKLSTDARLLLGDFYNEVERAQSAGGEFETVRPYASKAAEQAARLAGVLTLWGDVSACEVSPEAMAWGIDLSQYYLKEAKRLAAAGTVSSATARAEKLRQWLIEKWPEQEVLVSDIVQKGPAQLRETKVVQAALGILESHGWVVRLPAGSIVRGAARKSAFRVVR